MIRSGVVLSKLTLAGVDAPDFLQGYVTSDIDRIDEVDAQLTCFTDIKGNVIANGWIKKSNEGMSILTHPSTSKFLHEHLSKYLVFSKATLLVETTNHAIVQAVPNEPNLQPFEWAIAENPVVNEIDIDTLITHKFVLISSATSAKFLPQSLALTDLGAVSFSKGCYLGQEVVARVEHRGRVKKRLVHYDIQDGQASVGDSVSSKNRHAGTIVMASKKAVLVVANFETDKLSTETCRLTLSHSPKARY